MRILSGKTAPLIFGMLLIFMISMLISVLSYPTVALGKGGTLSVSSSNADHIVEYDIYRIADPGGEPLFSIQMLDALNTVPELTGNTGRTLFSKVTIKASEDDTFATWLCAQLDEDDRSQPRARISSDTAPVTIEDGWYALKGTRKFFDGRTSTTPVIIVEVAGEPIAMEEKPSPDPLPIPDDPDVPTPEDQLIPDTPESDVLSDLISKIPKLGENTIHLIAVIATLSALSAIILAVYRKRRGGEHEQT